MDGKYNNFIKPHIKKFVGYFLFLFGIILFFIRFYYNYKPDYLEFKTFVFYSEYIETFSFETITNNLLDEISGILLLLGQFILVIEFVNKNLQSNKDLIIKNFLYSFTANTVLLLIAFLYFYGLGFIYLVLINIISFNSFFILFSEILTFMERKKIKQTIK